MIITMEGICEVIIDDDDGEEWIFFDDNFNQELSPEILEFLSKYQKNIF